MFGAVSNSFISLAMTWSPTLLFIDFYFIFFVVRSYEITSNEAFVFYAEIQNIDNGYIILKSNCKHSYFNIYISVLFTFFFLLHSVNVRQNIESKCINDYFFFEAGNYVNPTIEGFSNVALFILENTTTTKVPKNEKYSMDAEIIFLYITLSNIHFHHPLNAEKNESSLGIMDSLRLQRTFLN
eukprot:gene1482-871_t